MAVPFSIWVRVDLPQALRKFPKTAKVCGAMLLARTFGKYEHSIGGSDFPYAVYLWRGKRWAIPTGPFDVEPTDV